jgi:predicted nicotinamide N-methyase
VDALSFIRENAALTTPPLVPEVALHLAVEALPLWEKTEEELQAIGLPPPYWAFAWAGGQALARYVLDHPELVAGRAVLDVASGSGLVAIAAMKAGALRVEATEIDAIACAAIAANAEANGAAIRVAEGDPIGRDVATDVVLVGDAFYEKPLADRLLPWLERLAERGASVLIGDPGRSYFPTERFELIASYEVPVTRALEDAEIKRTSVWRLGGIRCPTPSLELVKRGKV